MLLIPPVRQVELEMAINATSPNYCRSKGEQIALNVDGAAYDETNTYSTYVPSDACLLLLLLLLVPPASSNVLLEEAGRSRRC